MEIKGTFIPPGDRRQNGWRYDPTITLGHLLTTFSLLAGLIVWGVRLEGRIDGHDQALTYWRNQNGDIKRSLERIEDRLNKMTDASRFYIPQLPKELEARR